jgi:hypothetical protein
MHKEILSKQQVELLPLIQQFRREFYLVGGTAIALHIGHRRSIDFDLFKPSRLVMSRIIKKIDQFSMKYLITRRVEEQLNLTINNVKVTFFEFPFDIEHNILFERIIKMPDLLSLAAMKAYALGRRSKWKDYVDLYYILNECFTVKEVAGKANSLFGQLFSEKLFRAQLSYFDDIDYSEPVDFLLDHPSDKEIKAYLIEKAIDI